MGFSVLWFWLYFRSVFHFCAKRLGLFGFGVHYGLQIFRFLAFGFRFSVFGFRFSRKILTGFRI